MIRVRGMLGLGDNLYQRAVLRLMGDVELETPWPQLYADLSIRCIRSNTTLRTQQKNAARQDSIWHRPTSPRNVHLGYNQNGSILESLFKSVEMPVPNVIDMSGPPKGAVRSNVILVRPATIRNEWRADARNPDPRYIAKVIEALKSEFTIVSVADLSEGHEWAVGHLPFAHETYHSGELKVEELLQLVEGAAGTVGGVGWITPASMAYKTPHLCLFGGWGAANGPQRIFDKRVDHSMVVQVIPDSFCMCNDQKHNCEKTITNLDDHIEHFYNLAKARTRLAT